MASADGTIPPSSASLLLHLAGNNGEGDDDDDDNAMEESSPSSSIPKPPEPKPLTVSAGVDATSILREGAAATTERSAPTLFAVPLLPSPSTQQETSTVAILTPAECYAPTQAIGGESYVNSEEDAENKDVPTTGTANASDADTKTASALLGKTSRPTPETPNQEDSTGILPLPSSSPPSNNYTTGNTNTATGTTSSRKMGTRPSPWREPRSHLPLPAKDNIVVHHQNAISSSSVTGAAAAAAAAVPATADPNRLARNRHRLYQKLFSDAITVCIPLTVTAHLGVALKRTRAKRIAAIYKEFPALSQSNATKKTKKSPDDDTGFNNTDNDDDVEHDDNEADDDSGIQLKPNGNTTKKMAKKLKKLRHVPQPHEFASVIDYLEAKYTQGVVIHDDDDDDNGLNSVDNQTATEKDDDDDDDEGAGSVYSETSFLDDSGLQRTVAEQVLGHQTTTKLEMLHSDDSFFVNVGDLEVEETEMTRRDYDPLEDTGGKKRKQHPQNQRRNTSGTKSAQKKPRKQKSKEPIATVSSPKKATASPGKAKSPKVAMGSSMASTGGDKKVSPVKKKKDARAEMLSKDPTVCKLKKEANEKKKELDAMYNSLKVYIQSLQEDELPKKTKPKRTRVVVKIPYDNKLKDSITFANPHIPGQKLKVKIPPNLKPGDTFKVTVPKPVPSDDADNDPNKDYNKLGRDFYAMLEDFSRLFDEWCDSEGSYRKIVDGDKAFQPHLIKREKFDKLVTEFPKDLKTPVDKDYLKKILRRARQNKYKREQTVARQLNPHGGGSAKSGGHGVDEDSDAISDAISDSDGENSNGENNNGDDDDDDENGGENSENDETAKNRSKVAAAITTSMPNLFVAKKAKPVQTMRLPQLAISFASTSFLQDDFIQQTSPP